jgi:regulator of sirC expression with transglutaminase-like and TPR domain
MIERYRADPGRDELAAAILVARLLDSSVIPETVTDALAALVGEAKQHGVRDAVGLVDFLRECGFRGADDPQRLDCSRIDLVVARRRGIPITLAIVYLTVGRWLGLDSAGVNFPSHFLAQLDGVLVDPLGGRCIERSDCVRWLQDANLEHLGDDAFAVASPDAIALRMLNNVKAGHVGRGDIAAALDTIDWQLLLSKERALLHLERADLWYRLGDAAAAVAVLEAARDEIGGAWQGELDVRLKRWARRTPPVVH